MPRFLFCALTTLIVWVFYWLAIGFLGIQNDHFGGLVPILLGPIWIFTTAIVAYITGRSIVAGAKKVPDRSREQKAWGAIRSASVGFLLGDIIAFYLAARPMYGLGLLESLELYPQLIAVGDPMDLALKAVFIGTVISVIWHAFRAVAPDRDVPGDSES